MNSVRALNNYRALALCAEELPQADLESACSTGKKLRQRKFLALSQFFERIGYLVGSSGPRLPFGTVGRCISTDRAPAFPGRSPAVGSYAS